MSDLVQRLCEVSADNISSVYEQTWPHSLLREAAARIEELEKVTRDQLASEGQWIEHTGKLEAALWEITTRPGSPDLLRRIARQALEKK